MISRIHPQLWKSIAQWCQERALAEPLISWEGSTTTPEQVSDALAPILARYSSTCFERRDIRGREHIFLVERAQLVGVVRDAFTEKHEVRLSSLDAGHVLHVDPTGWAEDANEICVTGSGQFAPVVRELHDCLKFGALKAVDRKNP